MRFVWPASWLDCPRCYTEQRTAEPCATDCCATDAGMLKTIAACMEKLVSWQFAVMHTPASCWKQSRICCSISIQHVKTRFLFENELSSAAAAVYFPALAGRRDSRARARSPFLDVLLLSNTAISIIDQQQRQDFDSELATQAAGAAVYPDRPARAVPVADEDAIEDWQSTATPKHRWCCSQAVCSPGVILPRIAVALGARRHPSAAGMSVRGVLVSSCTFELDLRASCWVLKYRSTAARHA